MHTYRKHTYWVIVIALIYFALGSIESVSAQSLSLDMGEGNGGSLSGRLIQLFGLVTILSLAPAILIMMTSFTRIVVVLSLLRNAIGLQQSPPNQVIVSLAMFLTIFVMSPTLEKAYTEGIAPLIADKISEEEAFNKASAPIQEFMATHARGKDLKLFVDLAKLGTLKSNEEIPLRVLIPAFMISELRRAFEIGFLIFLPFLVIDLVVASILMSMGMMMLPPSTISLPFKLIFFVLIDGWHLIAGSLVQSYGT